MKHTISARVIIYLLNQIESMPTHGCSQVPHNFQSAHEHPLRQGYDFWTIDSRHLKLLHHLKLVLCQRKLSKYVTRVEDLHFYFTIAQDLYASSDPIHCQSED